MNSIYNKTWIKIIAFILTGVFACGTIVFGIASFLVLESNMLFETEKQVTEAFNLEIAYKYANIVESSIYSEDGELLGLNGADTIQNRENFNYKVTDLNTGKLLFSNRSGKDTDYHFITEMTYDIIQHNDDTNIDNIKHRISVEICTKPILNNSIYSKTTKLYLLIYRLRHTVFVLTALFFVLFALLFTFQLRAVGHKKECDGIYSRYVYKLPIDVITLVCVLLIVPLCFFMANIFWQYVEPFRFEYHNSGVLLFGICLIISIMYTIYSIIMLWFLTVSIQFKKASLLSGMLITRVLKLIFKVFKKPLKLLRTLILNMPMMWKSVLILVCISFVEILVISVFDAERLLGFWFAEKMLILFAILLLIYNLKKIQFWTERLVKGDFKEEIDTTFLFWHFKKHVENINSIRNGLNHAVEERMKSERFKTELITNVSHDIKTPLTSIINYVDLLKKENPEGERVQEYLSVLERQSDRLKKLTEDLVEASKATSGSISVNLKPCLVDIALVQAVGEYQEKLETAGLEVILKKPNDPITILADGRHLWRVFDNLLGNICKHALVGSRVYLVLEQKNECAIITFKNISKYELDISSEELMERFVRGDRSRNTDGNGLGLSIARSLTEIQSGTFNIKIDGDLFKAVLEFPTV